MKYKYFTRFEGALLIGLAVAILLGAAGSRTQSELADKMLRLHVVANSDSAGDQDLKLKVRDGVFREVTELTADTDDVESAREIVSENLENIKETAKNVVAIEGYTYAVDLRLEKAYFPTKDYDDFSIPAGEYDALRVIIGEGDGKNWWCVLFPPFCTAAAMEEKAVEAGFTNDEIRLISADGEYEFRFRIIEWISYLKNMLKK